MNAPAPQYKYNVYAETDRGEGHTPRIIGGYVNAWPMDIKRAESLADQERRKPWITKVEVRPA